MKFCYECGFKLNGNEDVCPNCGTKFKKSLFNNIFDETKKIIGNNEIIGDITNKINIEDIHSFVDGTSKSVIEDVSKKYQNYANKKVNYFNKAKSHYSNGKYKKSIKYCDKYIELDSSNWEIYYFAGDSYFNLEKYEEAIDNLEKSLQLKPNNVNALLPLADSYRLLSKNSTAISHYDSALKIDFKNLRAVIGKSLAYYNISNYNESISYFNKADHLGDLSDEELYVWSEALIKLGKLDDAKNILKRAVEINKRYTSDLNKIDKLILENSNDPDVLYRISKESFSKHDYEYSIKYLRKALSFRNDFNSLILIAEAEYYLAKYDDALNHCNEALTMTQNSKAYNLKGEILMALENYNEAINSFIRALTYGDDANIYSNMGLAYYLLGNHSQANDNYFKALSIENKNSRALIGKALIEQSKRLDKNSNIYSEDVLNKSEISIESMFANCLMFSYKWNDTYWGIDHYRECEYKLEVAANYADEASKVFKKLGIDKDFWLVEMAFDLIGNILVEYIRKGEVYGFITRRDMTKISSSLIRVYGKNEVLCTNHGQLLLMYHEYDDAVKSFDDALSFNPKPINRCRLLSYKGLSHKEHSKLRTLRGERWYLNKSEESFNSSLSCYDRLLQENPIDVDILNEKAHTLVLADRKTEAVHCFEEILRIDPNNELAKRGMNRIR